jgi:uncharacterized protein YeaO (DUF488 family)
LSSQGENNIFTQEQAMAILVVQLGSPRKKNEGMRIGTVRRPPRGVRKTDYSRLDYYDIWLPQLAPSAELVKAARNPERSEEGWRLFEKRYTRELFSPDNLRLVDLLAALSKGLDLSIGCYCEDEKTCHRSILKKVLAERGASIA